MPNANNDALHFAWRVLNLTALEVAVRWPVHIDGSDQLSDIDCSRCQSGLGIQYRDFTIAGLLEHIAKHIPECRP